MSQLTRRTFTLGSLALSGIIQNIRSPVLAQTATPAASGLPSLEITLTDDGFELPDGIRAGRYEFAASNTGTMTMSHFGIGKFPDEVTEQDIEAFFAAQGEDTEALSFDDIAFVGAADWPQPGQPAVTGVIDLQPGRYIAFKPLEEEEPVRFTVEGKFSAAVEPAADLTVTLREMTIDLPETAFTSSPMRWKIEKPGAIHHEVSVLAVPPEFDADTFMMLMSLPEDATPPPGTPEFEYQPVAAIGILASGGTSWLDVQLEPGHYMATCMLPFGTGYPHAMDGMFVFFDVT
ncbi:MAG: hypothetical protein AVDCRST_MAG43-2282 [uncultured Thermomicrobiales bacterium]|uniref:Uncharacterized protein n=1 Tax=uncultured Thermomicrobiales bacterium TaxID=1645740 RepID=A0A6J4V371_9BACT|nr:MAG: hypothetical protein AVDCRST_MAG43-2282 [uncultured Thermomicrobiales bacterium]